MGTQGAGEPRYRWLFGDQLGPHFLDDHQGEVVMIESKAVFKRRRFHRAKAHLMLSAMRHRAAELGDRVRYVRADTYREGLERAVGDAPVSVCHPTSHAALRLVTGSQQVTVEPPRGFLVPPADFAAWAGGTDRREQGHLRLEDFYRTVRRRHDLLMDGDQPAGGRWNWDADNRQPPPSAANLPVPGPYLPREDDIDAEVRRDLDRWETDGEVTFVGHDAPRTFPASRREALRALTRFVDKRLATFGRWEDAMLAEDWAMSHSLLSAPLNLGLLDPAECTERAEAAYRAGQVPLNSAEGFIRQIAGWREYVWHLYWLFGKNYRHSNTLRHRRPLPDWFLDLDADAVQARCLSTVLAQVRDRGWVHHIPRLMILGNYALQRGWHPAEVTDWFHRNFVDGYDWVMLPNVIGMSQYADGGRMTTKPYVCGGAYIDKMSDLCHGCAYRPDQRVGDRGCPYAAGYWWFLDRHRSQLQHNARLAQPLRGLDRLTDLNEVVQQERHRADRAP
ncbi:cryptochrome/photolyase family protein [Streptomyces sp. NPDC053560]|uniref:cryptochrome/photolyase family protein n=1 Tax=Streptomyces sp. NPDC053560 TaxID=3365711 RepID=UPI0037D02D5C